MVITVGRSQPAASRGSLVLGSITDVCFSEFFFFFDSLIFTLCI